jgi:peroxiredoxin
MDKKLIFCLLLVGVLAACKHNSAKISGTLINPVKGTYLILDELRSNELKAVDSVMITADGSFKFSRELKQPSFYLIKSNNNNFLTMLLAPGDNITIKAHADSLNYPVSVEGSAGTEQMADYNKTLRNTINKLTKLNRIYEQNTNKDDLPRLVQSLDSMANMYLIEINTYTKKYIDDNLGSLVSLVALYQQVAPGVYVMNPANDIDYFRKVDSSLIKLYPDYDPVKTLHDQVSEISSKMGQGAAAETSGSEAPEIALPSPQGDTIKLSSTRGSVVLLDFWASWCSPCRKENPNLVAAYNQFHRKGFQIFQVSLDKTKEAWTQGIQDDHLDKWIHVSDLKYWNSIVVPLYKVESIPCNFLLDKDGKIIASNLRGERLQQKLTEIFK